MPITVKLPPEGVKLSIANAAYRAQQLHTSMAMAWALNMRITQPIERPHWLDDAVKEINALIEALQLEIVQPAAATDAVDALFDRANVVDLNRNGQVLR